MGERITKVALIGLAGVLALSGVAQATILSVSFTGTVSGGFNDPGFNLNDAVTGIFTVDTDSYGPPALISNSYYEAFTNGLGYGATLTETDSVTAATVSETFGNSVQGNAAVLWANNDTTNNNTEGFWTVGGFSSDGLVVGTFTISDILQHITYVSNDNNLSTTDFAINLANTFGGPTATTEIEIGTTPYGNPNIDLKVDLSAVDVPEPASFMVFGVGVLGLALTAKRRRFG